MALTGMSIVGGERVMGTGDAIRGENPRTAESLQPEYRDVSLAEIDRACRLAFACFDQYRQLAESTRAEFLERIAEEIEAIGSPLIERAMLETGLPQARLEGERGRTCIQLRLFASLLRSGNSQDLRIDTAMPDRQPLPRADIRMRQIGVGPVAVFGASNFPLAFSVAGGDTTSALAAGCPVVVKAHPAHPGTSELVAEAICRAVVACDIPKGVFSLVFASTHELGQALVSHPCIQAVGFTGSRQGGLALLSIAQSRPQPIPVYAEMSSINPVLLLPDALQKQSGPLAEGFIASLALGAGQFCTNPGLVLAIKGEALNQFKARLTQVITGVVPQVMLSRSIHRAYQQGIEHFDSVADRLAEGINSEVPNTCQAIVYHTTAAHYLDTPVLHNEVFGAVSLLVECESLEEMQGLLEQLEGQLTLTVHLDDQDQDVLQTLLPVLERRAGRILLNGWPTGVEVCHAMVHGGPYPATSDVRTTSVGSAAIQRFLRPVCYQNFPDQLLPPQLKQQTAGEYKRLVDGIWQ